LKEFEGLLPNGVVGPRTGRALRLDGEAEPADVIRGVTVQVVAAMFPHTPLGNINGTCPSSPERS
jgi:putative chitinase